MLYRGVSVSLLTLIALLWMLSCTSLQDPVGESSPVFDCYISHVPAIDEYVEVDMLAEMIHYVQPDYPRLAYAAGLEGTVWIKVLVDINGKVAEAVLHKSCGTSSLDEAALSVAPQNRFRPAIRGECRVATWVAYKVTFDLDNKQQ